MGKRSQGPTLHIRRGKFKQRFLSKHSSLLKRSETAHGILVTCGVNNETRALGQTLALFEDVLPVLFPNYETTWERYEGHFDVDESFRSKKRR
ncbi:hypothetical protein BZG36_05057, partial [Bifiguratus adelaidae]